MKLFPVLIKELLDKQQTHSDSERTGLCAISPGQEGYCGEVKPEAGFPSPSSEGNLVLAEIPNVTDPPAEPVSEAACSTRRFGGRLFSPNLSARILLGGGVVLFLIAALPMLFRSAQPPEQDDKPATMEGKPVSATRSATPQKIQSDSPKQAVSSASAPSGSGPSAQQAKAEAQPTPTAGQADTTAQLAQQSAQTNPTQQSGSTKKSPDQGAGTTQLASRTAAGGQKSSERGGKTSPPSPGTPAAALSSVQQTPTAQVPPGNSTQLADIRSQLSGPIAHDAPGGVGNDAFQGGIAAGETPLPGQRSNPSGYSLDTPPPTVYYPTSANYPISPNGQMVYYPSTDGRWYPVVFPPGRPTRSSEATYVSAGAIGQPQVPARQEPVTHPGGPSTGWAWPRNQYQEVSRKDTPYTGGFAYPNQQDLGSQVQNDRRYAYPSTRGDLVPSGPAGYPPSGSLPQHGPSSGGFPGSSPANSYQPDGGVPSGRYQPFGRSTGNASFESQEPGVARFNGTIEKPPIRSAYDGTGSSLY